MPDAIRHRIRSLLSFGVWAFVCAPRMSRGFKMSKRRIRPGVERVYENNRVIKIVPQVEVARLLKQKKAVEIYCNGVYVGIRLVEYKTIAAARTAVVDADRVGTRSVLEDADARRSCVVLSRAAVESLADRSRSKTAGLPWISSCAGSAGS